jgi:hypothetical protein
VKFPNPEQAVVDLAKLRDYCLNPRHPRGRHKARVFATSLGFSVRDAELLRSALLRAAVEADVTLSTVDAYGQRYVLDFELQGPSGKAVVRSSWIVRSNEDFPRMTSCYVL